MDGSLDLDGDGGFNVTMTYTHRIYPSSGAIDNCNGFWFKKHAASLKSTQWTLLSGPF